MYLESSLTKCQPVSSSIHSTDLTIMSQTHCERDEKLIKISGLKVHILELKKKKRKEERKKTRGTSLVRKLLMQGARQRNGEKAWGVNGSARVLVWLE